MGVTISLRNVPKLVTKKVNTIKKYSNPNKDRFFGTLVHGVLNKYLKDNNKLNVEAALKYGLKKVEKLNPSYMARFIDIIYNFNYIETFSNIKEIYKELSLTTIYEGIKINGRIDKIIVTKEGDVNIVDYKVTKKLSNVNNFRDNAVVYKFLLQRNGFNVTNLYYYCNFLDFHRIDGMKVNISLKNIKEMIINGK